MILFRWIFILILLSGCFFNRKPGPKLPSTFKGKTGVIYNSSEACPGVNVLTVFLDARPRSEIFDLEGNELATIAGLFPLFLPDRLIYFNSYNAVMIKSDGSTKSEPISFVHHDASYTGDEIIFIDSPRRKEGDKIYQNDSVRVMNKDLKELENISILPESKVARAMAKILPRGLVRYDYDKDRQVHALTHINSVQIIPANDREKSFPPLKRGNLLINDRKYEFTYILDRKTGEMVWSYWSKSWGGTHSPRVLPNGNILFFVNNNDRAQEGSYIAELDPRTKTVVWQYRATAERFLNLQLGSSMPICDGHVLVTHTTNGGSAFEINRKGEIVWEWFFYETPSGKPDPVYRVNRIPRALYDNIKQWLY